MANFEIKDFELLKSSLLNYMYYSDNALTDFNVGSVFRCMLESVAQEEEEMYFRLWQGIQNAIKQGILYSFNFTPELGTFAFGAIVFGRDTEAPRSVTIPSGTIVLAPNGASYKIVSDVTIAQNDTEVTVIATATTYGSSSNLLVIDTPLQMVNPVYGITWVKNSTPIAGGTDTESQASIFARFTNYIASLSRGTLKAIEYGASTTEIVSTTGVVTERVVRVKAYDYVNNLGQVNCYIENGAGGASYPLIVEAQKIIDGHRTSVGVLVEGWKSAGVIVTVIGVTPVTINVNAVLAAEDFYAAKSYVQATITQYFANLDIGQSLNYEKIIADCMYSYTGIIDIHLINPGGNIYFNPNEIAVLGTLTITAGTATNGNL